MIEKIFILLIAFQIKHLIADYYLQYPYMYENKGKATGWFGPLFDHARVHAVGTLIIVLPAGLALGIPNKFGEEIASLFVLGLVLFDFLTHFIIDRWKATRGRHPGESKFWTDLGIDQMLHHIVGIIIIGGLYYGAIH